MSLPPTLHPHRLATALAIALSLPLLASAQPREAQGAMDGDEPRVLARVRVDPRGEARWRVGVELVPDPGWHLYGREPGDVGLPPRIEWRLPGARFGELEWPPAARFWDESSGIESFGYDRPVLLATDAEVPPDADALAVSVDALVCANMCLPAHFELAAPLDARVSSAADRARFAEAARELTAAAPIPAPAPPATVSWLGAVLLGWLGGLALNLMPCVLPVLAIKLAALADLARCSRREQVRHAAAYVAGICLSMLALAAVVVVLRGAGTAVGWGFQLQEPVFVVAICALLVAFAANLFGAYEIAVDVSRIGAVGSRAPGAARSFFDGLLAVALATPCSAPFLGTAVGFAFASSAPVIAAIFLSVGLGLATPFVLAAGWPAIARRIPRSGAWMSDLRVVLGFALLLAVIWLLWILGRVSGPDAVAPTLVLLLVIAAASWGLGLAQRCGRSISGVAIAFVLVAIAAPGIVTLERTTGPRGDETSPFARKHEFSADAVRDSLAAGRPVFVYFTADWCLTCKVNERALADPRVEPVLTRGGYDVYRADWTRRDAAISAALAALGKAGVPAYAVYSPADPAHPRLLPELLSADALLATLRDSAPAPSATP